MYTVYRDIVYRVFVHCTELGKINPCTLDDKTLFYSSSGLLYTLCTVQGYCVHCTLFRVAVHYTGLLCTLYRVFNTTTTFALSSVFFFFFYADVTLPARRRRGTSWRPSRSRSPTTSSCRWSWARRWCTSTTSSSSRKDTSTAMTGGQRSDDFRWWLDAMIDFSYSKSAVGNWPYSSANPQPVLQSQNYSIFCSGTFFLL